MVVINAAMESSRHRKRRHGTLRHYARRIGWHKALWVVCFVFVFLIVVALILATRMDSGISSMMLLRKADQTWDSKTLHVVITRFMQDQPNLVHLGRARLLLFEKVCLPCMIQQSTRQFVWIIQTDPHLDKTIRESMIALLRPYPNFFLVGSNMQTQGQTFRTFGTVFLQLPQQLVYTGDMRLLRQAVWMRNRIPLLQTRLDADDALESTYLQTLQDSAEKLLRQNNHDEDDHDKDDDIGLDWHYWCIKRHFEWYAHANMLKLVEHSKLCITPGLTIGLGIQRDTKEVESSQPPLDLAHDVLYKTITEEKRPCSSTKLKTGGACIRMVTEIPVGAVRSRTWTSAGMMDIFDSSKSDIPQEKLWEISRISFGIFNLQPVAQYLESHIVDIAKDNLKGQCTNGHSCKQKALEALQRLIDGKEEVKEITN